MKINKPNDIVNLEQAYSGKRVGKSEMMGAEQVQQQKRGEHMFGIGDLVNISSGATKIQQLKSMVESIPDIREGRVNSIKASIESGNYQINSGMIAHGMLREEILNHLL